MPNNDRTGPLGMGSQTGRGAGLCNKNNQPPSSDTTSARKPFRRQGRGRCQMGGKRGFAAQSMNNTQVENELQSQIQQLQQQLDRLRQR